MKKKVTLMDGWFLEYSQEGSSFRGFISSTFGHWIPAKGTIEENTFHIEFQVFDEARELAVEIK